ncbi:MAG: hypothetical protein EKK40_18130 [Bradyrhizobiaceae bacterium]|nr:MAG: hypothetical protein EKK40_18130 [Bradyrhizobiaceae bacterium]
MPLQNRVTPFGDLVATSARGTLMGNRGGRIHDEHRTLGPRRWVSRQWICCVLDFKGRHRSVWGDSYTELFFLDEPTAFAAGHRPCFECRRRDAKAFADGWRQAARRDSAPSAADMDRVLHAQRLNGRKRRLHSLPLDTLPDGAFVASDDGFFAVRGDALLPWREEGYGPPAPRPRGIVAEVLTPPAILGVLASGYAPRWHLSAGVG